MRFILLLSTCLPVLFSTAAHAAESVIGAWASSVGECRAGPESQFIIKAMSINSNGMNCYFESVSRKGNVVQWEGTCYGPDGDARDGGMTATLKGKSLSLNGSGLGAGPLVRCRSAQ